MKSTIACIVEKIKLSQEKVLLANQSLEKEYFTGYSDALWELLEELGYDPRDGKRDPTSKNNVWKDINPNLIICPGCGWTGEINQLTKDGSCPKCGYETGKPPRLLTTEEMLKDKKSIYNDVRMGRFLKALFQVLQ